MKILHLDKNHPLLIEQLAAAGFENEENYYAPKDAIEAIVYQYDGIILRSRFKIDRAFIDAAPRLKFIGRVGAGLENIDCEYALSRGIKLFAAPEGNRTAVAEHATGMLLSLINKLNLVNTEVRNGIWLREENRGFEIEGKTIGIIGYGFMGKAFAQRLKGFNCQVICYDIKPYVGDANATQVSLEQLQQQADVVSLHTPESNETHHLINSELIAGFAKSFWFINTARGKSVDTEALVGALKTGKIKGAGLDVLEYEKSSFENMFTENELPKAMQYLIQAENVLLSPHIAGWTIESKQKLAQIIVDRILTNFKKPNGLATEVNNAEKAPQLHVPLRNNAGDSFENTTGNQNQQNNNELLAFQKEQALQREIENKRLLAGIMALLFGFFGVHKFILGYTAEGIIYLVLCTFAFLTLCFIIGYFVFIALFIISFIEGIIYLTKSNEDFYKEYILHKRPWF